MKGSENATMRQSFTRMCYGERFPLYVADAKPKPQAKPVKKIGDDTNKKLEHILLLLTALFGGREEGKGPGEAAALPRNVQRSGTGV